ncbi:uncharacterized protein LAESUDRAFT_729863 [Laetiporus sulphureus 93-53]|uniref:WW domain-containing protein n=1 Tax=Laetiporus sulphureus 93-53 TaxID=1314785 RepID=A0A165CIH2_9APHY|nr:uncharacterized protein LAESUDRAFT_729863 [Laetiporus sulphureus 93-53]KZT02873.1 hypothetical protein LAESUDRAFT_729863 [Laetiporus sulphureus 93-53]
MPFTLGQSMLRVLSHHTASIGSLRRWMHYILLIWRSLRRLLSRLVGQSRDNGTDTAFQRLGTHSRDGHQRCATSQTVHRVLVGFPTCDEHPSNIYASEVPVLPYSLPSPQPGSSSAPNSPPSSRALQHASPHNYLRWMSQHLSIWKRNLATSLPPILPEFRGRIENTGDQLRALALIHPRPHRNATGSLQGGQLQPAGQETLVPGSALRANSVFGKSPSTPVSTPAMPQGLSGNATEHIDEVVTSPTTEPDYVSVIESIGTRPMLPAHRYTSDHTISPNENAFNYTIKPLERSYPLGELPENWTACVHPEGVLYFFETEQRIITEADIRVSATLSLVQECSETLRGKSQQGDSELPPNCDVVITLDTITEEGAVLRVCSYYFVDHAAKMLFWIDDFEITEALPGLKIVQSTSHLKYAMEGYYWLHCDMFPHDVEISVDVLNEAQRVILHAIVDRVTVSNSTIVYEKEELQQLLSVITTIKSATTERVRNAQIACIVGRIMHGFALSRFLNHHGQKVVRLRRNQSILPNARLHRTLLMNIISPLLLRAPAEHMHALRDLLIDGRMSFTLFGRFINKLQTDWQEDVLYATVLINANISFMTINEVDSGVGPRTPAQIASLVSTAASIGSVLAGLLLMRSYRLTSTEDANRHLVDQHAEKAFNYLASGSRELALDTLAITYSLPYALLMYGMLAFLVAFAFECFIKPDDQSRYASTGVWAFAAIFVMWCLYMVFEPREWLAGQWVLKAWDKMQKRYGRRSDRPYERELV